MAESILNLDHPWEGLSEAYAFGDQPVKSARELQNMRLLDCRTGRNRLAQRSGLTQYLTSFLKSSGTKVADLIAFFIDNRGVTYSALSTETETWSARAPAGRSVLNVKTDRQGNVYATDGNAGLVKLSSDEALLWQLALPIADANGVVRALFVDEFDVVYAGVSEGGQTSKAKMFCYEQLPDNKTEKLWEIETKAFVEQIVVANSKLYTIQNDPDNARAYVRIYEFFDTANPELSKEWRVPFPANSLAIKKSGEVIVASEPSGDTTGNYWRLPDPKFPNFSVDSVSWTPYQLDDFEKRVWSWYVADDIDQTDVASDIEDGVTILRWRDRSKNFRHFVAALDESTTTGPKLALNAMPGGHKAVRFDAQGTISSSNKRQALKTLPNSTIATEFADTQRTMIPVYTNSSFALFVVCRPSQTQPDGDQQRRWILGQDRDNAQSGSDDHILFANANDEFNTTLPPKSDPGGLFWYYGAVVAGGSGSGGSINAGDFDVKPGTATTNPGNFVTVAMIHDGGITGDSQDSLFQINGNPIELFTSGTSTSLQPSYLGIFRSFGTLQPDNSVAGFLGDIVEILVLDRRSRSNAALNVLTYDPLEASSGATSQSINELTTIVGYLNHKYGAQANLPFGTAAVNNYPHPYGITGSTPDFLAGPPAPGGTSVNSAQALANKRFGAVIKYAADGSIVWCANEMASGDGSRPGGFGFAVAVNSDGNIYSLGPNPTGGSGGTQQVRMIVDQGTTFSINSADGAWSASYPSNYNDLFAHPQIDVDEFDNLYAPFPFNGGITPAFRVYQKTGTVLHETSVGSLFAGQAFAVAVDRRIPDYRNDITPKRVEHVITGIGGGEFDEEFIIKTRIVLATQSGASPRTLTTMGVSGGDIVKFTTSGVTTPTGGSGALDSTAKYVQSVSLFKKVYWTDGRQYRQYDPITDTITEYVGTSSGSIPARCQLIDAWRGRIVLARSADEPHNWFLSKQGDPLNFDFFPPVPGETDAVAGNNSPAGLCPDIINALVPYSEDILVFGCDHSIWMLVGDPAAGGRLELVSDITGMAFGRPHCKDPNGVLYFFGSQGGVFRWVPGAKPERVSLNKIERQLQDVDLATNYIRLVYNYRDEGLHILQCPFGDGGTTLDHWFLELKGMAFSKDKFGNLTHTNVQPTAVVAIDGDDFNDRVILFGCEDGKVRRWDATARSDDVRLDGSTPIAIDSYVTLGPLQANAEEQSGLETQFSGLTVVLSDQDQGARYELFASDEPESIGIARRMGDLNAGRNPPKWDRVVGPYCWLRLRNAAPEQRWALERATLRAAPAGMTRPRIIT